MKEEKEEKICFLLVFFFVGYAGGDGVLLLAVEVVEAVDVLRVVVLPPARLSSVTHFAARFSSLSLLEYIYFFPVCV